MAEKNYSDKEKLHAACDECRTRKLKCSGDSPACSRCARESIQCIYSPQKQMGRPRKRRRDDVRRSIEATPELGRDSTSSSVSGVSAASRPSFGEFGMMSPPNLNDFSGFPDFPSSENLNNGLSYQHHDELPLTTTYAQGPTPAFDFDVGPNIDPSLWDAQPAGAKVDPPTSLTPSGPDQTPCTCLSILYLTLTDLQTMTSFSFPAVISPMRQAMSTASTIIHCEKCPRDTFSAIQNVLTLSSLFSAIASRFHKVLNEIEAEADRLEESGTKKTFRIGDTSPAHTHLHTNSLDCPMGFDIELDGSEWRRLAKKALKTEVLGGGSNPAPLKVLIDQFESRQTDWHFGDRNYEERARMFGADNMCKGHGDANCLRMIESVKAMLRSMVWE
ncbi:hypothetical protein EJ04DRAFT_425731 [Polyplosphaeria fusca]|uniref:Zn(2)-C6 fungal-type domain-containing protein n=1 Tax=Polyplosphaeria fusca TaxID=682080 RepID=A0A9P4R6F1_9PLEO|nr:hypothetical protein EJ04DRAFT_425731 [Polyplosphaeria fusca]